MNNITCKRLDELMTNIAIDCTNTTLSQRQAIVEDAQAEIERAVREIIGENVKDNGATVVRNNDGSVHSSSAGSYAEHIKSDLRAEQLKRLDNWIGGKHE